MILFLGIIPYTALFHKKSRNRVKRDYSIIKGNSSSKLLQAKPRMTLFTGSSRVAEKLAVDLKGRIKLEDAGFDWKILGPDVQEVCESLQHSKV